MGGVRSLDALCGTFGSERLVQLRMVLHATAHFVGVVLGGAECLRGMNTRIHLQHDCRSTSFGRESHGVEPPTRISVSEPQPASGGV